MVNKITDETILLREISELSKQNHHLMIRVKELLEEIYKLKNPKVEPCRAHDESWEEDNKRIDIIGQNGNDGLHYGIDDKE